LWPTIRGVFAKLSVVLTAACAGVSRNTSCAAPTGDQVVDLAQAAQHRGDEQPREGAIARGQGAEGLVPSERFVEGPAPLQDLFQDGQRDRAGVVGLFGHGGGLYQQF
jgi:hypothetical protein